jgi:hypothetical protein
MQLKTITLFAASLALAQAKVNGTWGDETKAPVLDTTTPASLPTKPTDKPVDGGKSTPVADDTASSTTTWADADLPSSTKPVADETTSSTTVAYWGDETSVADETTTSSSTWADQSSWPVDGGKTDVADETTSSTVSYWGDASISTPVADTTASSSTWGDYDVTTSEETTVEQVTKTYTKGDGSQVTTTEVNTKTITHTVYITPQATPVSDDQAPPAGGPAKPVLGGEGAGCGVVTVTNTVVQTITVPAGGKPTAPPAPPAPSTPVIDTSVESHTWADAAVPSEAPSAPVSGGYMGIVEQWRGKLGLSQLDLSDELQSNAQNAADSSGGQLKHKLNPGSMAQVMAPGDADNFESVFVGGWLCELPSLPGLGASVCNAASKGWNYAGQTGHAEILTSSKYSKIGCALGDGIWCCDLA